MYPYEGMILVHPTAHAEDPQGTEAAVKALFEKHGAKFHDLQLWDERKLAYEIEGHKRGVYLLGYFEMPGDNIDALRAEIGITEKILRHMLLRLDTDIPTHLERAAVYEEKMKKDVDERRPERGPREGEAAATGTRTVAPPKPPVTEDEAKSES